MTTTRTARTEDSAALVRIDDRTWSSTVTPAPRPDPGRSFFSDTLPPAQVVVAERDGRLLGFATLTQQFPIPAHAHVLMIGGLAVDPAVAGSGVGTTLVRAAIDVARGQGATKLTLRVLGSNPRARHLYERCGFVVEGVLRGEFRIDGTDVDDILMAVRLGVMGG